MRDPERLQSIFRGNGKGKEPQEPPVTPPEGEASQSIPDEAASDPEQAGAKQGTATDDKGRKGKLASVYLTDDEIKQYKTLAFLKGKTFSKFCGDCLRAYIADIQLSEDEREKYNVMMK